MTVMERFKNPYIEHQLYSILLNTVSKYKTRNLPSLLEYHKRSGVLPDSLIFSLAALMVFYRGKRNNENIRLQDDNCVLDLFARQWHDCGESPEEVKKLAGNILSDKALWGQDLTLIDGLTAKVAGYLSDILEKGMTGALSKLIKNK
jgi:tagaturonate reductase